MRRADIKAGEVYAYCEGRPRSLLHTSFTPYFILDNRYYTLGSDDQITLAPAGARPHASRHRLIGSASRPSPSPRIPASATSRSPPR